MQHTAFVIGCVGNEEIRYVIDLENKKLYVGEYNRIFS